MFLIGRRGWKCTRWNQSGEVFLSSPREPGIQNCQNHSILDLTNLSIERSLNQSQPSTWESALLAETRHRAGGRLCCRRWISLTLSVIVPLSYVKVPLILARAQQNFLRPFGSPKKWPTMTMEVVPTGITEKQPFLSFLLVCKSSKNGKICLKGTSMFFRYFLVDTLMYF